MLLLVDYYARRMAELHDENEFRFQYLMPVQNLEAVCDLMESEALRVKLRGLKLAILALGGSDFWTPIDQFNARFQRILDILFNYNPNCKILIMGLPGHPNLHNALIQSISEKNVALQKFADRSLKVYHKSVWRLFQDPQGLYLHDDRYTLSLAGVRVYMDEIKSAIVKQQIFG